jgi:hypothetical protein
METANSDLFHPANVSAIFWPLNLFLKAFLNLRQKNGSELASFASHVLKFGLVYLPSIFGVLHCCFNP